MLPMWPLVATNSGTCAVLAMEPLECRSLCVKLPYPALELPDLLCSLIAKSEGPSLLGLGDLMFLSQVVAAPEYHVVGPGKRCSLALHGASETRCRSQMTHGLPPSH